MRRVCALAAIVVASGGTAHAYEFWLRAQTIGQAYELRDYRLVGPDLFLARRRFTQTLALRIFDVGDLAAHRRRAHLPERGLRVSWHSYLRVDHDFGEYTAGRLVLPGAVPAPRDALDVIPELGASVAKLDLLYAYAEFAGLADDRVTLQLGRVSADDGWGTTAFDGGQARVELPAPVAVTASAGLRVRASSLFGVAAYELDGTSGAGCREYVEGPTPGSGSWQLIDRNRAITGSKLASDYAFCPQRDVRQPTVGVAIATSRTRDFGAELGYRRTWSDTVGLIGRVDRLTYPDTGLYPNDFGQAPATGVDEERVFARVHARFVHAGVELAPFADARYSILHAALDRADVGVRVRRGDHVVEPIVAYFYPTFDGDSIFNAFSLEPTLDARVGYRYAPVRGWRANASGWLRRYAHEDTTTALAGGGDAGVERALGGGWRGRVDALYDDGYGGRRAGATAEGSWRGHDRELYLRARTIVLGVREDQRANRDFVTSSTVLSTTWRVADRAAVHGIVEVDYDRIHALQTRAIAVLDLAFEPEP